MRRTLLNGMNLLGEIMPINQSLLSGRCDALMYEKMAVLFLDSHFTCSLYLYILNEPVRPVGVSVVAGIDVGLGGSMGNCR